MQSDTENLRKLQGISIIDVATNQIGSIFIFKVIARDQFHRQEIAIAAVDLAPLKGKELADALESAYRRARLEATAGLALAPVENTKQSFATAPGSNVTSINQSAWQCSKQKQMKILTLWQKLLGIGITEDELRETLHGYGIHSRKDLTEDQAAEFIQWLADTFNAISKQKREATHA